MAHGESWVRAAQPGLSERRALRVKHDLEQHFSLPAERLLTKGYGMSRSRALNETESGRRQNHRIEAILL